MIIEEKPKKKKKNFTPEQKQAFVERMKKAREAKLLKKAQELNAKQSQSNPPSNVATTDVIEEKPKKTRKPRVKQQETIVQPPQPHINYDYTHINNLNSSINMLNQNLMNLATRSQPKPPTSEPKSEPQVVEKEKEIKIEPLKETPQVQKIKMAEIPQHVTTNENPIQKRKIWNATRRAFVYI